MTNPATPGAAPASDEGFLESFDGTRLFHRHQVPEGARAQVLFVHGYGDHLGRYPHVFEHLNAAGYGVHAFDYRGHGRSEGRRGHVGRFPDYVGDLNAFLEVVRPRVPEGQKLLLVAHSNGCLITARWILEGQDAVSAVAMSGPFLKLGFEPPKAKIFASVLIGKVIPHLSVKNELSPEMLTHNPDFQKQTAEDPLYNQVTTPRWFTETLAAQEEVRRRASEITVPLLVMQGLEDTVVSPEASRAFFDAVTSPDKSWEGFEGMRHELYMETGRAAPLARLTAWLDEHA